MFSFNTHIDQLYMELICGQLLQKELQCKQEMLFNHGIIHEALNVKGVMDDNVMGFIHLNVHP